MKEVQYKRYFCFIFYLVGGSKYCERTSSLQCVGEFWRLEQICQHC